MKIGIINYNFIVIKEPKMFITYDNKRTKVIIPYSYKNC